MCTTGIYIIERRFILLIAIVVTGLNCETCADGFFGDATIGTVGDCAVCPCYSPRVDNSTCALDSENVVRCSYCAEGYRGRYCDE